MWVVLTNQHHLNCDARDQVAAGQVQVMQLRRLGSSSPARKLTSSLLVLSPNTRSCSSSPRSVNSRALVTVRSSEDTCKVRGPRHSQARV